MKKNEGKSFFFTFRKLESLLVGHILYCFLLYVSIVYYVEDFVCANIQANNDFIAWEMKRGWLEKEDVKKKAFSSK